MKKTLLWAPPILGLTCALIFLTACPSEQSPDKQKEFTPFNTDERDILFTLSPLHPPALPDSNPMAANPKAIHLGQYLFYEPKLSPSGRFSCATCHDPYRGFGDGLALGQGISPLGRHTPSLWNVAYQRWFFWDGRTDSLWAQAIQPFESEAEMGGDRLQLLHYFHATPELKKAYQDIFGDLPSDKGVPLSGKPMKNTTAPKAQAWLGLTQEKQQEINLFLVRVMKSIAAYERTLLSNTSPFDRFVSDLRAQKSSQAISLEAKQGLRVFIGKGQCILCHTGPQLTDNEFHNTGLPHSKAQDLGRYQGILDLQKDPFNGLSTYAGLPESHPMRDAVEFLDAKAANQGEFKTPGLRQISKTAPYMHDGRFKTLKEVIGFYSRPNRGNVTVGRQEDTLQTLNLNTEEIQALIAFLKSLDGPPLSELLLKQPKSPQP